ncbi:hypothetical protein JOB18_018011 [Solea senegalensis]|uniref:Programmed cell death 1 ligand 1-like isoform X2 n=1 Tax=Solea senegalensis TaxID=28829 RepID=A0AAV6Q826_SOLSE|nr:uncharacterized protein LOC122770617 [Solea senegalensis]XP_043883511.1 uncharacterized protein LOC122770617 [Solea senegalensis]KAG7485773.1 programmed cell death 1 ligand 1-like isoform X2 [Solea senegalensis]KAG7485774.1 hypothetical protein JOB18_018011 [Solea senegalensis]KAG7485775.1 hypothetical protein JOB18_018011 [Solea senegalensis]
MGPQMMLLLILSHICAGTFVVNVSQKHYNVREDDDITLEWRFTRESDGATLVICDVFGNRGDVKTLYYLHRGEEQPDSQDEQFSGRVRCDRNCLREGRVTLHLSRVTLNDSGTYACEVHVGRHADFARCEVNVSAATDRPKAQATTLRPRPDSEGRLGVYITLVAVVTLVIVASVGGALVCHCHRASWHKVRSASECEKSSFPEKRALSDSLVCNPLPLLPHSLNII